MMTSTKHRIQSPVRIALEATEIQRIAEPTPSADRSDSTVHACRWGQSQERLLIHQWLSEIPSPRNAQAYWERNATRAAASQNEQPRMGRKGAIADWIELSAMLIASALVTLLCACLL
jgi:hypothetical protein